MTTLNEKATPTPTVRTADESEGWYRLESDSLTPAADIGNEDDFPRFGDFLETVIVDVDGPVDETVYIECPQGLARALVEAEVGAGDLFAIEKATKNGDGEWSFAVDGELDPSDYEP